MERLLVVEEGRLLGILTKRALAFALGQGFDPLTGLPRADFLRGHLERLLEKGVDPTVVFVDLDDFGLLNKQLGHTAGDQALKEVAGMLSAFARRHRGRSTATPGTSSPWSSLGTAPKSFPTFPSFSGSPSWRREEKWVFLGDSGRKAAQEAAGEPQSHRRRSHSPGQLGLYPGQGSTRKDSPGRRGDPG